MCTCNWPAFIHMHTSSEFSVAGRGASMYVFLPNSFSGLSQLEKQLTMPLISEVIDSLQETKFQTIEIPKFQIKYKRVCIQLLNLNSAGHTQMKSPKSEVITIACQVSSMTFRGCCSQDLQVKFTCSRVIWEKQVAFCWTMQCTDDLVLVNSFFQKHSRFRQILCCPGIPI